MNRRQLFRAAAAAGAWTAAGRDARAQSILPGQTADSRTHPNEKAFDLAATDWKPAFFDAHQNETLIVLSDRIIPETGSPGARAALANRFIDLVLAAEESQTRREFIASLSYIDGESQRRYRKPFIDLPAELQAEMLEFLAFPQGSSGWTREASDEFPGHRHFENLKGWISDAFYSSEIGMRSLGWDGQAMHGQFVGCKHDTGAHAAETE